MKLDKFLFKLILFSFLEMEFYEVTNNKNIMRATVLEDVMTLQFASEELKNDKEIVRFAVTVTHQMNKKQENINLFIFFSIFKILHNILFKLI